MKPKTSYFVFQSPEKHSSSLGLKETVFCQPFFTSNITLGLFLVKKTAGQKTVSFRPLVRNNYSTGSMRSPQEHMMGPEVPTSKDAGGSNRRILSAILNSRGDRIEYRP